MKRMTLPYAESGTGELCEAVVKVENTRENQRLSGAKSQFGRKTRLLCHFSRQLQRLRAAWREKCGKPWLSCSRFSAGDRWGGGGRVSMGEDTTVAGRQVFGLKENGDGTGCRWRSLAVAFSSCLHGLSDTGGAGLGLDHVSIVPGGACLPQASLLRTLRNGTGGGGRSQSPLRRLPAETTAFYPGPFPGAL
jgi:hypothetical protein